MLACALALGCHVHGGDDGGERLGNVITHDRRIPPNTPTTHTMTNRNRIVSVVVMASPHVASRPC